MKRYIAALLVLAMVLPLAGCNVSAEELAETVKDLVQDRIDNAIEEGKQAVSDAVEEKKEGIQGWIEENVTDPIQEAYGDVIKKPDKDENVPPSTTCVIRYDANGGYFETEHDDGSGVTYVEAIEAQVEYGKKAGMSQRPINPGHHFLGYTRVPGARATLWSGEKIVVKQDVTLYAVWSEGTDFVSSMSVPAGLKELFYSRHKYTVDENDNIVTIKCRCGMELTDRTISKDEFVSYCKNSNTTFDELNVKQQAKYNRKYVLYKAREFGPVAMYLYTSYYQDRSDTKGFVHLLDSMNDLAETVGETSDKLAVYADAKLTDIDESILAEELFGGISDFTEKIGTVITVSMAAHYFAQMVDKDGGEFEAMRNMLNTIQCVTSLLPVSVYFDSLLDVVMSGVDLMEKCVEYEENNKISWDVDLINKKSDYLYKHLSCSGPGNYDDPYLIFQKFGSGCTCVESKESCPCTRGPSVYEVMKSLSTGTSTPRGNDELYLGLYLAERAEHEFFDLTGVTLMEYAEMFK